MRSRLYSLYTTLVLVLLLSLSALVTLACSNNSEKGVINIIAMRGPTGMGFGQFNERLKLGELEGYSLRLENSPDNVVSELASGRADIASLPSNLAPVLVNNGKVGLQILAINVGNVIHLIRRTNDVRPLPDPISSLSDLSGKKVAIHGAGSTPEAVFKHLLDREGVDDVELDDRGTPEEVTAGLSAGTIDYAILPQPAVTANTINGNAESLIDLGVVWEQYHHDNGISTGVIVARSAWIKDNSDKLVTFMQEYQESIEYMINPANIDDGAQYVVDMEILPNVNIAKVALPLSGLVLTMGETMKSKLETFYGILLDTTPNLIGGKMPDESIYYQQ